MRDYLQRLLIKAGFEVDAVADGQAALDAVRTNPPDLVLSDITMSSFDGFGMLRELRANPETPKFLSVPRPPRTRLQIQSFSDCVDQTREGLSGASPRLSQIAGNQLSNVPPRAFVISEFSVDPARIRNIPSRKASKMDIALRLITCGLGLYPERFRPLTDTRVMR